jgi:hypothetical protein
MAASRQLFQDLHRPVLPTAADFSLAVSLPSPALILRPSRYAAGTPHHFPYFSAVFGAAANDSIQLVRPPEYRPATPIEVRNIDLPVSSGRAQLKTGVSPNIIAIVHKLQRRIHFMHHFNQDTLIL